MFFKRPLAERLDEYGRDHAQLGTRLTHMLGVPMVVLAVPMLPFSPALAGGLFVGGWALQYAGRKLFEGQAKIDAADFFSPTNLLVGAIWAGVEWGRVFGVELPLPLKQAA